MNITLLNSRKPIINIKNHALNKMNEFVHGIDKEIGWLGTVTREGLVFTVEDVFLFKQEVHSTTTEITPDGLNEFAMELMSDENGIDIWNNMKLWGHSHVNMGVSPSGQDNKQVETFESCGYDFFIRVISNKKGEMRIDLYDYEIGIAYHELTYNVVYEEEQSSTINIITKEIERLEKMLVDIVSLDNDEVKAIKDEIKEKVTVKTYQYTTPSVKNYGYQGNYWDSFTSNLEPVKKNQSETIVIRSTVDDFFDSMGVTEIFEAYITLESEEDLSAILSKPLTKIEMEELEELIYAYVFDNKQAYLAYLDQIEDLYNY